MTISTSTCFHRFFIAIALASIILLASCSNNVMYGMKCSFDQSSSMEQESVASDFQLYQLLSSVKQGDSEFYLHKELVQVIAITAHNVTEYRCYQEHGACLTDADSLLNFIEEQDDIGRDIKSTVNIVKTCLKYSGKSLCTLYCTHIPMLNRAVNRSFFIPMNWGERYRNKRAYRTDVICQVAGKDLMELLCMKDYDGELALSWEISDIAEQIFFATNKFLRKETLKELDLLNFKCTPNHIKIILEYLSEADREEIIIKSLDARNDGDY